MLHEFVRRGWVAVTCNYRLAPKNPWPAQIEDVTRTLAWIKKYNRHLRRGPDTRVVAGGSAGGHLAPCWPVGARPHLAAQGRQRGERLERARRVAALRRARDDR